MGASRKAVCRSLRRLSRVRSVLVVCDIHAVASLAQVDRGLIARRAFKAERREEGPLLELASAGEESSSG
jgi:hypothetical protein